MEGAVAGAVPISVHDWMRSACQLPSTSAYAESAVELALALTKHLCLTAAASAVALEKRITAENVLVFVARAHRTWMPMLYNNIFVWKMVLPLRKRSI